MAAIEQLNAAEEAEENVHEVSLSIGHENVHAQFLTGLILKFLAIFDGTLELAWERACNYL